MLYITGKKIDENASPVLFSDNFDSGLENWEAAGGNWNVSGGRLEGLHRGNGGGIIYSKQAFSGDVMLDFTGMTIPPCENDLNFTWKSAGWDNEKNDAGESYIGGVGGWWTNKAGLERYPGASPAALTDLFKLKTGTLYRITAGSIGGHCFLFVDGKLIIEMYDQNPVAPDGQPRFVGLGTYASHASFANFRVLKPLWTQDTRVYAPQF